MRRKRTLIAGAVVAMLAVVAVIAYAISSQSEGSSDSATSTQAPQNTSRRAVIVYLTRTGNTEAVAKMIHDQVGGTLTELRLETPYPEDYQAHVDQVSDENARNHLPPLRTRIDDIDQYDTVFLGAPTWGMQLPPPMKRFLEDYDLSGKTIAPFNTNGGYGVGSSFDDIEERCSGCNVLEGFTVEGGRERDGVLFVMDGDKEVAVRRQVRGWLDRLDLLD